MKKTITLEAVDPIELYGVGNKILTEFCSYFPHLKVVARGHELILEGRESDIEEFQVRFGELVERRHRKMNLTVYDVEDIFDGTSSPDKFRLTGDAIIVHGTDGKPIRARNKTQEELVKAYFDNDLVFAVGPAGTGKTYIAIALAVRALKNREIKRIILTRPAVEAGERLGFLPGDLKDKLDPYLQPLYDALEDMIPSRKLQEFMADGTIQIAPLAYMRGRTLDRACGRGAEHEPRTAEDVPDPYGHEREVHRHGRRHAGGPAPAQRFRSLDRHAPSPRPQGRRDDHLPERGHRPASAGGQDRESLRRSRKPGREF